MLLNIVYRQSALPILTFLMSGTSGLISVCLQAGLRLLSALFFTEVLLTNLFQISA